VYQLRKIRTPAKVHSANSTGPGTPATSDSVRGARAQSRGIAYEQASPSLRAFNGLCETMTSVWPIGARRRSFRRGPRTVALPTEKRDQEWTDQPMEIPRNQRISGLGAASEPPKRHKSHVPCARAWLPRSPFAEPLGARALIREGNWLSQVGARFPSVCATRLPSESRTNCPRASSIG